MKNKKKGLLHIIVILAIVPTFSDHLALQLVSTPSYF